MVDNNKAYWIDMEAFTENEVSIICELFSIHHLTYEDIVTHDSSEKSEEYANYVFVSTSEVSYSDNGELVQNNIYMLIFKRFVLVFHPLPLDCHDTIIRSFRYLDQGRITSASWVLCTFFDSFNDSYSILADQLMGEVNVLDEYTLRDEIAKSELYVRLGRAIRKATNLLSWLFIKTFTKLKTLQLADIPDADPSTLLDPIPIFRLLANDTITYLSTNQKMTDDFLNVLGRLRSLEKIHWYLVIRICQVPN
eukprot:gene14979-17713_t